MLHVELLLIPNCPHAGRVRATLRGVLDRLAPGADVRERVVRTMQDAETIGFPGSPTVRVQGRDVAPDGGQPALACRIYDGSAVPAEWMIEAAVLRASAPAHVLFLCVANSARSQMAEAIARRAAPAGVKISSAGSAPTRVRPEALLALREIGIDASAQRSRSVDEVEGHPDVVITLCAEEVCPAWLHPAKRVHWALPDPAAAEGSEEARLDAFRSARNELVRRIERIFPRGS